MKRIPSEVKTAVRRKAESEWPDDFDRQLVVVGEQLSAYRAIGELIEQHGSNPILKQMVQRAVTDCPDDYVMQLQHIETQLAAEQPANFNELTGDKCFDKAWPDGKEDPWRDDDMQMLAYRGYWGS